MQPWQIKSAALIVNAGIVSLSTAGLDSTIARQPTFWAILLIASMLCIADSARVSVTESADRLPKSLWPRLLCQCMGLAVFAIWWTAIVFATPGPTTVIVAGLLIAGVGAVIRFHAVHLMGNDFVSDVVSERRVESGLVTQGLYARVRHPSELGLCLTTLGAAIAAASLPSLAIWAAILMPVSYLRIRLEESHLQNRFGDAFEQYQQRTGLYLPWFI